MKKLLTILILLLSVGSYAQSITEVMYPLYVQGVGSSNASDDRKVPFACRMTVNGLTANATYRYYPRFVADPLSISNGQGNYIIANQSGNFTRVTSATLATLGRYGEFNTDLNGSFTGWFVIEPSLALEFQPGTTLYFRLMLNNGANGGSVATRITATNPVTVLGWGSGASQGTGLRAPANAAYAPRNFMMFYNNLAGTGRPLSGTYIENDGTDNNAITSGYAPFYANNVDAVDNTWGTIIPNNLSNGVNNISQYSLSTGAIVNSCTSANGVYGSTNTANANGGLTELVLNCTPTASCSIGASAVATNVLCNGGSTGSVDLTVTGGTAPLTFAWSNTATTEDLSGVPAGTYTVTVTDANNCTTTASATVSEPVALVASSVTGPAILCNGGTTTVTVSATGGTAPYSGTGTFTAGAGSYSYTVTDVNGCTSTTTGSISEPSVLSASAVVTTAILCNGGSATVTVSATGGTAPYTGVGTFSRTAGTYSFTVTDANGCTGVASVTVSEPTAVSASAVVTTAILCNGGSATVTVSATGGTAPYTGEGTFSRTAGTYNFTVTDANGCTTIASVTVTQPMMLNATATVTPIPCGGTTGTVTINATGGTAPYTGTGAFVTSPGNFSYTVTDANGCTRTVTGRLNSLVTISANAGTIACGQTTTTVSVNAAEGTAPYTGTGIFTVGAGPYSFTVTDANGCTATASGTIAPPVCLTLTGIHYPQFVQGVGSSNAADDRKVPYAAYMTVGGLNTNATYRYYPRFVSDPSSSTNGQGNYIIVNQSGNFNRVTSASLGVAGRYGEFTTDASGNYTGWFIVEPNLATEYQPGTTLYLRLMLNNGAGGSSVVNRATATDAVTVLGFGATANDGTGIRSTAIPEYNERNFVMLYDNIAGTGRPVSGTFIESDGTVNSVANGYAPFYANNVDGVAKTWGSIIPNNLVNGINNISQFALSDASFINKCTAANGVYGAANTANANGGLTELVVSCTPIGNCNISASIVGTDVLCNGSTTGAANLTVTGATAPISYGWSNGANTEDLTAVAAGTYTVTVTDANNCTATASVTINEPTALVASAVEGPAILCNGGTTTVTVSATGGTAPYTGTGVFTVSAGSYSYTVTDANGCTSVTSGTINEPAALIASSTVTSPILCNGGGNATVTVSATGGTAPYTGTGTFSRAPGTYNFTVSDANGCTSSTSITVTQPAALNATAVASPLPCGGTATTVVVNATGGTAPYTGTGTFNVGAGPYSFTVTDANGCTRTVTGRINNLVTISVNAGTIACGETTAIVSVSASEGTAPYTGTGTFTVTAGTYTYTVTDANGCTASSTVTVSNPVCPTLNGVLYPQYVQGVGSSNAADDRKVPYGARMVVGGLTANATYRYYPRFVADPLANTNGQGNYIITNTSGSFNRVTSASLAIAGRYGEFTTDGTGSYEGWFIVEPNLATEYQPGTTLYLRLMLNNGAGGSSVALRATATQPVTVLGFGSTSTDGTGIRSTPVTSYGEKNFIMLYDNIAGTGRPVSGTFIESDGTVNSVANGYAPFYANSVDGVAKTWGSIIPNNLSNGINNISQYALATGALVNDCTSPNGVFGTANTANANGGLTELVINCVPGGTCDVTVGQISGPTNACAYVGAAGLLATYTVSSTDVAPGFTWTIPATATDVAGQGTNSISFRYPVGYTGGTISVAVTSVCAATEVRSLTVTVSSPALPASITGPVNVCPFIGTGQQLTYSVPADPAASGFTWTVPTTVSIVSGQGTNSIVVTINNGFIASANKRIRVRAISGCGSSAERILYLLAQLPNTPSPISGPVSACPFIGVGTATYSVPSVAGATSYIWTAQAGTIITFPNGGGVNGNTINIAFPAGFTTSAITVRAASDCGTSGARSLTVTRTNPSTPGLISGPTNPCIVTSGLPTYSITPVAGATSYTWTAPAGATLTSVNGPGANDVVVTVAFPVGFVSGTISVVANNGCGSSSARTLNVARLNPATPGAIDAVQTSSCPNRVYTYSLASLPSNAVSVQWTVPVAQGAVILSGQGTNSITVSYPATAINSAVTATAQNNCSNSPTRSLTVKLPACPPAPPAPFVKNGLQVMEANFEVNVFPNPSVSDFKLQLSSSSLESVTVRIVDVAGREIKKMVVAPNQIIGLGSDLKSGAYLVQVLQGRNSITKRIVKF